MRRRMIWTGRVLSGLATLFFAFDAGIKLLQLPVAATVEELWDLWTTKEGFESWWGPEGFRVEVQAIDAGPGGALKYNMIADAPEAIEAMRRMGQPISHGTTGTFSEVVRHRRIGLTHLIDFVAGVAPYESTAVVEFHPSGDTVRVVNLSPMHDDQWTRNATMGWTSQLTKLDKHFAGR